MTARYHIVAITLHWLIAALIIFNLGMGLMMDSDWVEHMVLNDKVAYFQWHKTIGLLVLFFSLLRLMWRLTHKAPLLPDSMPKIEKLAAHAGHFMLYVFMISVPLTGWLLVSASTLGIETRLFNVIPFANLPLPEPWRQGDVAKLMAEMHGYLAYSLLVLVLIHVAAALRHYFLLKDDILRRMLPVCKMQK